MLFTLFIGNIVCNITCSSFLCLLGQHMLEFLVYNWYFYENTVFFKKPKRETFALKKYNMVMK